MVTANQPSADFLVLDIETDGGGFAPFNPAGFRLLMAGTRHGAAYGVHTAAPASLGALADLLDSFEGYVVTYNGDHFDLPVLDVWFKRVLGRPLRCARHFDLLAEVAKKAKRRISLDDLSENTFGMKKLPWDHRRNAQTWRDEPQRMVEYNRRDLDLTYELFMRVLRGERVFLGDATVLLDPPRPKLDML